MLPGSVDVIPSALEGLSDLAPALLPAALIRGPRPPMKTIRPRELGGADGCCAQISDLE
jgi:hypothetical protein